MPDKCECAENLGQKRLAHYLGAVVLGMNDALVEMTGALAGFTIALGSSRLIILAGITTGAAATLSMACAEFMADKAENPVASPHVSAALTGLTYILTVAILLLPYFLAQNPWLALFFSLLLAVLIIVAFTYATSCIKKTPFRREFLRMLVVSLVVAALAFAISWFANSIWGV